MDKAGLLLIHGTVYGSICQPLQFVTASDMTENASHWGSPEWWDDSPVMLPPAQSLAGVQTIGLHSIDFVHWDAGGGEYTPFELGWWRACMTLFMRHI